MTNRGITIRKCCRMFNNINFWNKSKSMGYPEDTLFGAKTLKEFIKNQLK